MFARIRYLSERKGIELEVKVPSEQVQKILADSKSFALDMETINFPLKISQLNPETILITISGAGEITTAARKVVEALFTYKLVDQDYRSHLMKYIAAQHTIAEFDKAMSQYETESKVSPALAEASKKRIELLQMQRQENLHVIKNSPVNWDTAYAVVQLPDAKSASGGPTPDMLRSLIKRILTATRKDNIKLFEHLLNDILNLPAKPRNKLIQIALLRAIRDDADKIIEFLRNQKTLLNAELETLFWQLLERNQKKPLFDEEVFFGEVDIIVSIAQIDASTNKNKKQEINRRVDNWVASIAERAKGKGFTLVLQEKVFNCELLVQVVKEIAMTTFLKFCTVIQKNVNYLQKRA